MFRATYSACFVGDPLHVVLEGHWRPGSGFAPPTHPLRHFRHARNPETLEDRGDFLSLRITRGNTWRGW